MWSWSRSQALPRASFYNVRQLGRPQNVLDKYAFSRRQIHPLTGAPLRRPVHFGFLGNIVGINFSFTQLTKPAAASIKLPGT